MNTPLMLQARTLSDVRFRHPLASLAQTNFVAKEIVQDYPEVRTVQQFRALDLSYMQCMAIGPVPQSIQMGEVEQALMLDENDLACDAHTERLLGDYYAEVERRS